MAGMEVHRHTPGHSGLSHVLGKATATACEAAVFSPREARGTHEYRPRAASHGTPTEHGREHTKMHHRARSARFPGRGRSSQQPPCSPRREQGSPSSRQGRRGNPCGGEPIMTRRPVLAPLPGVAQHVEEPELVGQELARPGEFDYRNSTTSSRILTGTRSIRRRAATSGCRPGRNTPTRLPSAFGSPCVSPKRLKEPCPAAALRGSSTRSWGSPHSGSASCSTPLRRTRRYGSRRIPDHRRTADRSGARA